MEALMTYGLPGPKGDTGERGPQGPTGPRGPAGSSGNGKGLVTILDAFSLAYNNTSTSARTVYSGSINFVIVFTVSNGHYGFEKATPTTTRVSGKATFTISSSSITLVGATGNTSYWDDVFFVY